jgi:hypothetical protein
MSTSVLPRVVTCTSVRPEFVSCQGSDRLSDCTVDMW